MVKFMIVVSVGCGLGNQMFELAFARCLKKFFPNQYIKLDVKYAFPSVHNGIEVFKIFGLQEEIASLNDVNSLTKGFFLQGDRFEKRGIFDRVINSIVCHLSLYPSSFFIQKDFTEYYQKFFDITKGSVQEKC